MGRLLSRAEDRVARYLREREHNARERAANWLLRGVHIREARFGRDSLSLTDKVHADSTATATALGDLAPDVTSGRWSQYRAGAARTLVDSGDPLGSGGPVDSQYQHFYGFMCGVAGGIAGLAAIGNPGTSGTVGAEGDSVGVYTRLTTAAGAGSVEGATGPATGGETQTRYNPTFVVYLKTGSDITNYRIHVYCAISNPGNSDNLNQGFGIRYSTTAPDGGWVGETTDAVLGRTISAAIAAVAINTRYKLKMVVQGGGTSIDFTVDDGAVTTIAATLPTTNTTLNYGCQVSIPAAGARYFSLSRGYLTHPN